MGIRSTEVRLCLVVVAFAIAGTASAFAGDEKTPGRVLAFRTALRVDGPAPTGAWHAGYTNVAIAARNGELETGPLTQAQQDHLDAVIDWNQRIAISATIAERTTGYSLRIVRVALQRVRPGFRQFCVLVRIQKPRPGEAVEQRVTVAEHVVTLDRKRFKQGFVVDVPRAWVLREFGGGLVAHNAALVRPSLCRP
jgi:hypothetical protein